MSDMGRDLTAQDVRDAMNEDYAHDASVAEFLNRIARPSGGAGAPVSSTGEQEPTVAPGIPNLAVRLSMRDGSTRLVPYDCNEESPFQALERVYRHGDPEDFMVWDVASVDFPSEKYIGKAADE